MDDRGRSSQVRRYFGTSSLSCISASSKAEDLQVLPDHNCSLQSLRNNGYRYSCTAVKTNVVDIGCTMPDPFSIITAALSITSSAYNLCKTSSDLVSGIRDAPSHISHISEDLQTFYPVLRALQAAFKNVEPDADGLIEDTCAAVDRSLRNCVQMFCSLTLYVQKYKNLEPPDPGRKVRYQDEDGRDVVGKWSSIKWEFHKREIESLSSTLLQCKETCQLAVTTANL